MSEQGQGNLADIMAIGPDQLGKGSSIRVETAGSRDDVAWHFAWTMARMIRKHNADGRRTVFILPVGPTGQFSRLAAICNAEDMSCRDLVIVNMDDYCLADGRRVPPEHPYSFRGFMERGFYALLDEGKRVRPEHRHVPDPAAPEKTGELIERVGGVDVCFGGIGINGHVAFNAPPEPGVDMTDDEFRELPTRVLAVSREKRVVNSIFCGGDLDAVPPKCVTVGMKEILASRRLHFYLDWPWQQAVIRRTVHGPVTRRFPASFLQTHPDCTITMADYVAEAPGAVVA